MHKEIKSMFRSLINIWLDPLRSTQGHVMSPTIRWSIKILCEVVPTKWVTVGATGRDLSSQATMGAWDMAAITVDPSVRLGAVVIRAVGSSVRIAHLNQQSNNRGGGCGCQTINLKLHISQPSAITWHGVANPHRDE